MQHTPPIFRDEPRPRVLKLGGSLLTLSDWPQRLRNWLTHYPHPRNLLVVGGGNVVESIRVLDAAQPFDARFIHWLCIDLLDVTARLASQLLPDFASATSLEQVHRFLADEPQQSQAGRSCVVRVSAFYNVHLPDERLPEDWRTTSDSLAALLAVRTQAEELVLFKSRSIDAETASALELSQGGLVDEAFPRVAAELARVRIVDLRSPKHRPVENTSSKTIPAP